ncbi:hypothetical protein [Cohnella sp.]|uniref:hypothetical protein n=1 Tax=Cohnella sp. TaxID=1883426 RepID=UPI003563F4B2
MIRIESNTEAAFLQQSHQERQLDALRELYGSRRLELQRLKRAAAEMERDAARRREAIREKQREIEALQLHVQSLSRLLDAQTSQVSYDSDYRQRRQYYTDVSRRIDPAIACPGAMPRLKGSHRGVVVAPDGLRFQNGRISALLKGLAEAGFLCLAFTDRAEAAGRVGQQAPDGYYEFDDEALLLRWLLEQEVAPTVLCTWVLQAAWFDLLPSKTIWYDLCEHEDQLWGMDASSRLKHYALLKEAGLVTYSDKRWRKYAAARKDAFALETGSLARLLPDVSARLEVRRHAG